MNIVLEALSRKPFAVIGHRGARGRAPENTLFALRFAIKSGADIAEFDVQRTLDGVLVASHDPIVVLDGHRLNIRETVYSDLNPHHLPAEERVPRIDELLNEARGKIALFLEIKEQSDLPYLVRLLKEEKACDYVAIISFYEDVARKAKLIAGHIPAGLVYLKPPGLITQCKRIGCEIVLPRYSLATERAVRYAHRLGLKVAAWTVNAEKWFLELYRRGVDGIATDYPDVGVAIRDKLRAETK